MIMDVMALSSITTQTSIFWFIAVSPLNNCCDWKNGFFLGFRRLADIWLLRWKRLSQSSIECFQHAEWFDLFGCPYIGYMYVFWNRSLKVLGWNILFGRGGSCMNRSLWGPLTHNQPQPWCHDPTFSHQHNDSSDGLRGHSDTTAATLCNLKLTEIHRSKAFSYFSFSK